MIDVIMGCGTGTYWASTLHHIHFHIRDEIRKTFINIIWPMQVSI